MVVVLWKVTSLLQQLHHHHHHQYIRQHNKQQWHTPTASFFPEHLEAVAINGGDGGVIGEDIYGTSSSSDMVKKILSLSGGGIDFSNRYYNNDHIGISQTIQQWMEQLNVYTEDFQVWLMNIQDSIEFQLENFLQYLQTLPLLVQHVILVNIFLYLLWKLLPKSFTTRHLTVNTQSSIEEKRWYTFFMSSFSHNEMSMLCLNLSWFMNVIPDLLHAFGERMLYQIILLASLLSHTLPLITDAITRMLHRQRTLNKQVQSRRCYHGFTGVNIALSYLALTLKPDMVVTIHNPWMERDFSLRSLFCAVMTFNILALFVDMFVIPSVQSISHARDLGGLLAGMLVKYILCQTTWGKQHLKWNSRFKFCRRYGDVVFAHMTGDVFSSFRCGSILDMTYYIRLLPNIFLVDEGSVKLLDWDDDSYIGTQQRYIDDALYDINHRDGNVVVEDL